MRRLRSQKSIRTAPDRVISLGPGLPAIPERLLLAHARGEVLFICGAGVSRPAGLPDFRELVVKVYEKLDSEVFNVISKVPSGICNQWKVDCSSLTTLQHAEVERFILGDYDVVLGMLERRLDDETRADSRVRLEVAQILEGNTDRPAPIHRALMRLADRGGMVSIVTTNFDRLLEHASRSPKPVAETYSLGAIPRPTRRTEFSGVLHIHGVLDNKKSRISELVLTDQDFGEFYLRRRVVPDFVYDAARLFNLVLIGYSANDPPMRYLLSAVAADGSRFTDLKQRFTFVGADNADPVLHEDWKARGITPIHYDSGSKHRLLTATLERWADLSANAGNPKVIDTEIKRIVSTERALAPEEDKDLFDHFIRRSNESERVRLAGVASKAKADHGWLDAIVQISLEAVEGRSS
mgnify:CR=1 FL=1